jgi:enhancer of mRNA-decapping protein 4
VHKSSQYFAYAIHKEKNDQVHIFNQKLNEKCLLKSFSGRVVDLSFAHYDADVLLGCVDELGLKIFEISKDEDSTKMKALIVYHLTAPLSSIDRIESTGGSLDITSRIIWCMYIPDGSESSQVPNYNEASKVFVLTRRTRAYIFNLSLIGKKLDCSRELTADEISTGHLILDEHKSTILSVSFSPDGSAVATSCLDGEVRFFKISFDPKATQSQCLKNWYPHEDRPVTSLYFLDDHKNPPSDVQFWNFILTGTDYNREIKIWCCLKWECMQTIRFSNQSPFGDESLSAGQQPPMFLPPQIKTCIDLSSKYLVLSDLTRKCFYVLHLFEDIDNDVAKCNAISEFILPIPAVSFAIIDSQEIKYNQLNKNKNEQINEDLNSNEKSLRISAANDALNALLSSSSSILSQFHELQAQDPENNFSTIRLYCIQTKQLQELTILLMEYKSDSNNFTEVTTATNSTSSTTQLGAQVNIAQNQSRNSDQTITDKKIAALSINSLKSSNLLNKVCLKLNPIFIELQ